MMDAHLTLGGEERAHTNRVIVAISPHSIAPRSVPSPTDLVLLAFCAAVLPAVDAAAPPSPFGEPPLLIKEEAGEKGGRKRRNNVLD